MVLPSFLLTYFGTPFCFRQEFVDVPSGAAVSVYSEGLLDDRGATGRGGRERDHHPSRATAADKHGQGDKDRHRSRDGNPPSGGSRDKLNHHHSSPPHSSISSISTSATLVATANPHASVVHHSSRDDINNKVSIALEKLTPNLVKI